MTLRSEIGSLFQFLTAVVRHWGSLVTSGAIIGAIGLWQSTGHPVPTNAYWAIAVLGLFIAFYRAWREERITKEQATDAQKALATQTKPVALIRFAYEFGDNTACLYVKNVGLIADFFAQLRMPYELEDVHGRWAHTNDVRTRIPNGVERKLLVAKLHYTLGAVRMSQWEIFYAREGLGVGSKMATYSSVVGNRDAQAPDINLEIIVASDPDMPGGVRPKRIILHSNIAKEIQ